MPKACQLHSIANDLTHAPPSSPPQVASNLSPSLVSNLITMAASDVASMAFPKGTCKGSTGS